MSRATPVTKVGVYHPIQERHTEGHQLVGEFALDPDSGHAVLCTFLPAPLAEPEPPVPPAATPAQNLLDLAQELQQEQYARRQATDDIAQINTRHIPG